MRHPPHHSGPVRHQLLAMLASAPDVLPLDGAQLDAAAWAQLQHMARQHRLEPLLHEAVRSGRSASNIPADVAKSWAAAYQTSAMRTLAVKAALIRVSAILAGLGIGYAALKGARLAWHAYAHPALRPMRDLDILVSPARARAAFAALVDHGFTLSSSNMTPIDAALEAKHLPGLCDPATGTYVELHLRLFDHLDTANAGALLANPDALLADLEWLDMGGQQIAFLPATETLLHLIVHSAYDHRFDNGPQIFRDVAVLLETAVIDWRRFWELAREGEWVRGCHLVLRLTEQFMGPQPVDWGDSPGPILPKSVLEDCALMTLQDSDLRQDLAVQLQLSNQGMVSAPLLGRLLPPKHVIAAYAGLAPDQRGVWLYYPGWLLSRLVRTLRGAVSQRQKAELGRAIAIDSWLNHQPGS